MIKSLYLLPLKTALLSIRTSVQCVLDAIGEQETAVFNRGTAIEFLREARAERKASYSFFKRMQNVAAAGEKQLVSTNEETPFIANSKPINAFSIAEALKEDLYFRANCTGPFYVLQQALQSTEFARFLAPLLADEKGNILNIEREYACLENNITGKVFSVEDVLKLPSELAVDVLLDEVAYFYCNSSEPADQLELMHEKLENAFCATTGSRMFAEAVFYNGLLACNVRECSNQLSPSIFEDYVAYCPACLAHYLSSPVQIPLNWNKTVLRDFRTKRLINGKMWYRYRKGFYESEEPLDPGDKFCVTIYD